MFFNQPATIYSSLLALSVVALVPLRRHLHYALVELTYALAESTFALRACLQSIYTSIYARTIRPIPGGTNVETNEGT